MNTTESVQPEKDPEEHLQRVCRSSVGDGIKRVKVDTPIGVFRVWTRRVGSHPDIKVLLLHGGPGGTHEYLEVFENYFPAVGIEYYYYDQLGSYHSDQPDDPALWELPRFVDEVEQVRQALGLDHRNFYLYGQSWGGMLALEYALKYPEHLKGLVISNMMASIPAYNTYTRRILMPAMDQDALAEIQRLEAAEAYHDPRYMDLLTRHHYVHHVLRMPVEQWPESVIRAFEHLNHSIYLLLQGPSELGFSGILANWDVSGQLQRISVPTLVIGATHDTMDPAYMEWMARQMPNGQFLLCPNGSHMALYDDQTVYFEGLIRFIMDVHRFHGGTNLA